MQPKFSEDVIPLSDLKINPGKIINQTKNTHRPVLVTSRGRGVAVLQGLEEFENSLNELEFVKAIAKGMLDIKEGNTTSLAEVKTRLGLS